MLLRETVRPERLRFSMESSSYRTRDSLTGSIIEVKALGHSTFEKYRLMIYGVFMRLCSSLA